MPKQLLMVSAATMSLGAFLLAVFMNLGWAIPSSLAIIAFVLGFSVGLGPVSRVLRSAESVLKISFETGNLGSHWRCHASGGKYRSAS
jgi:hypothetical protein